MSDQLNGIFPVLPTPFDANGKIDRTSMSRLAKYAIDAKVSGVVFPGFASEVEHLSSDERTTLLTDVASEVGTKTKVIAGASAETFSEVVQNGHIALRLGINWIMVQPPLSLGDVSADITAFMSEISKQLPTAMIIFQNAPKPRGLNLTPQAILEIVESLPNVRYIKEETLPAGPAITEILSERPAHLYGVIGGGGARYIIDEYKRGASGAMPALELVEHHVSLDRAWQDGDVNTARTIYNKTLPLLTVQAVYRMRLTKYVLLRRGIIKTTFLRAPAPELDLIAKQSIDDQLSDLGLLTSWIENTT
ncbi:dihydrodipicolinate synthase family protein [Paracoccaceae bacterium]|nr:dihydrodipicolinate synthase family protein [Paracoccaceae bacterium]